MRYVQIGDQQVSMVGLGAWQFGSDAWGWGVEYGPEDARSILDRALELGINFIDTAEMYGRGQSETIIGESIRGRRNEVFLATKVSPHHLNHSTLLKAAHGSMNRLQTDHIDLYQVHFPNPFISHKNTMKAMMKLLRDGLVKNVGVSNYSLRRWQNSEELLGGPVMTNQVRYHLLDRSSEQEILPYAEQADRFVIAYSPIAQGLFSGRYTPEQPPRGVRITNPLFTPSNLKKSWPLVDLLREIGKDHRSEPSQIALAWLLRSSNVLVIPGAKTVQQLESNAAAADIVLSESEISALTFAAENVGRITILNNIPSVIWRLIEGFFRKP